MGKYLRASTGQCSVNRDVRGHSQIKANLPLTKFSEDDSGRPETVLKLSFDTSKMAA